ncbi:MAG: DSD1 family PLP-dependent enzyme [Planctomycetaceae bacterium]|nr:DSD1 family PLP-dependent enzyme [Planctomycetaceae bacterium]
MIGRPVAELDTPALCIDLDIMDANMRSMAEFLASKGKQWRPHVKCHKLPIIAHQQHRYGAIGVTSAKSTEAEIFAYAGIPDILIANMLAGEQKLQRVASMCRWANPVVAVDHFAQAEQLSQVCERRGVRCRVIIELDVGMTRVGARPGPDVRELAQGIDRLPGVKLVGIMGYEGHLLLEQDPELKRTKIFSAMALLEQARDQMIADGINCDIVSAGGTGSYQITADHPAVTELQAGGGIFADPFYIERCSVTGLTPALRLLVTVASRPKLERAVLDAGRKSLHPDIHPPQVWRTVEGRPLVDAEVKGLSAEHMTLELGPESRDLVIGDKLEVIPGYSDHTTALHDRFFGIRGGLVEAIWEIPGRGKIQ